MRFSTPRRSAVREFLVRLAVPLGVGRAPQSLPPMISTFPTRLGLFGIGLDTYWPQFKGLKNRLMGYQRLIVSRQRHPTTNET